jgi:alpha-L-rhamnosidase
MTQSIAEDLLPIPDGLVVLTFDDGNKSDITHVAPLLKRYGFSATFYVTEGLGALTDKEHRLTWEEIRKLHKDGFEIGNHTGGHPNIIPLSKEQILEQVEHMEKRCQENGIPRPTTFAYPGGHHDRKSIQVLENLGYLFARRAVEPEYPIALHGSRGPVYIPAEEYPMLIPSTIISGPNLDFEDLVWAIDQARDGRISVLTFHGVPDLYPHCSTEPSELARYMKYLHDQKCTVIAMRDLGRYVDPTRRPAEPFGVIKRRLGLTPTQLKCEYAIDPLGIDTPQPRFSWVLQSRRRGQMQSAYEILISSSEENLEQNIADLWNSGKVMSEQSVNVPYSGRALASGQKCWWKVRCWNRANDDGIDEMRPYNDQEILEELQVERASEYSEPVAFGMGLLEESDWTGKWICPDEIISSPLLRKEFILEKEIKQASVYISGLGYYELYINGEKVGDHVLDPGTTYYNNDQPFGLGSRVLYVTYDVTDQLQSGGNAVGVMLGNGWYSAEEDIPPSPSHREAYGDRPILIMQMNVEFADGHRVSVVTDDTWKTCAGPVTYNDYSNGETYDARLEKLGWDTPGYDDSQWSVAQIMDAPSGKLRSQPIPPIKVVEIIKPVGILNPRENVYVYDMGQNFSGWTRLRVSGPKGTKVTLKHGARVYDDNMLDARSNLYHCPDSEEDYRRGIPRDGAVGTGYHHCARQTDSYILKGGGVEIWEPRFTLHGFRYVELTGFPGTPTLENLAGRHVRSSVETVGNFTCSNSLINQIHQNICWTFMSSMQGFPQDAADRSERVGWLGDPIPEDFILNFDTASYWAKWADDLKDSQKLDGDIPIICPLHWRGFYGMMPVWKSTYPIVAWHVYQYYGDERILAEHYNGMKKLVGFLSAIAEDHIVSSGLGDHMEPQPDGSTSSGPQRTPSALTSTAYYYLDAQIVADAAEILGKTEDAARYSDLAEKIRTAFNQEFLNENTNQYSTGSQTSNAIPLYMGMVPKDRVDAVLKNLVENIVTTRKGHLFTGMLGTNALAQILLDHGAADVMYQIVTQTTFPGWGYMVSKGATTIWESWDGDPETQLSYNMKLFGSVDKFFYKGLAGINTGSPGYEQIAIKPCVVGDLKYAKASIKTVRGLVKVDWERCEKSLAMKVTIPVNSQAEVSVPKVGLRNVSIRERGEVIWEAGEFIKGVPGITAGGETEDYVSFHAGSGYYFFHLNGQ